MILSQDQYFSLRTEVASHFNLHPNEILIVGSAKLGFSIAPNKRYINFSDTSDIDVVLVSNSLFDEIWQSTFDYYNNGGDWSQFKDFKNYHFRGWIRPDKFPPERSFQRCSDWWEFFRELTKSGKYGQYKIRGALYKSWHYLENYQKFCTQRCKEDIQKEK